MNETVEIDYSGVARIKVLAHRPANQNFDNLERPYLEALTKYLKPGMTVYDIGAEEGEFSVIAAKIVGGDRMHLFEPRAAIWPNIRVIWEANELAGPAGKWPGFLGDSDGRPFDTQYGMLVWPPQANGPIATESAFPEIISAGDVPITTIDTYAAFITPPDVIMCDVEGAEVLVFRGAKEVLRERKPTIFLSLHPFTEKYGTTQEELFGIFIDAGYRFRLINIDHEAHIQFTHPERL